MRRGRDQRDPLALSVIPVRNADTTGTQPLRERQNGSGVNAIVTFRKSPFRKGDCGLASPVPPAREPGGHFGASRLDVRNHTERITLVVA